MCLCVSKSVSGHVSVHICCLCVCVCVCVCAHTAAVLCWSDSSLQHTAASGSVTYIPPHILTMLNPHSHQVFVAEAPLRHIQFNVLFFVFFFPQGRVQLQAGPDQHHLPKGNSLSLSDLLLRHHCTKVLG